MNKIQMFVFCVMGVLIVQNIVACRSLDNNQATIDELDGFLVIANKKQTSNELFDTSKYKTFSVFINPSVSREDDAQIFKAFSNFGKAIGVHHKAIWLGDPKLLSPTEGQVLAKLFGIVDYSQGPFFLFIKNYNKEHPKKSDHIIVSFSNIESNRVGAIFNRAIHVIHEEKDVQLISLEAECQKIFTVIDPLVDSNDFAKRLIGYIFSKIRICTY
ncbi:MAG: hypothetical protein H7839_15020 [Magnetococcus sp. YQC-5]